jgi:hypothetical protein
MLHHLKEHDLANSERACGFGKRMQTMSGLLIQILSSGIVAVRPSMKIMVDLVRFVRRQGAKDK